MICTAIISSVSLSLIAATSADIYLDVSEEKVIRDHLQSSEINENST
jgi:uncharacterized membrane protein YebE (DUF533 family)